MKLCEIVEAEDKEPVESQQTFVYPDTAEVAQHMFPLLQTKIEKMNKRARKNKLPEIKLEIVKEYIKEIKPPRGGTGDPTEDLEYHYRGPKRIPYYTIKVSGDAPKIAGYKFIATIEHQQGGNIIRMVPGEEGGEAIRDFYEAKPHYCDHCKKIRRRIDTFIIKEEKTGKLRQIGRNCLADFLGGANPKAILWWFDNRDKLFADLRAGDPEEYGGGGGQRGEVFVPLENVLEVGAALIRQFGYMSAKKAQELYDQGMGAPTTAGDVRWVLFVVKRNLTDKERELLRKAVPTAEDKKKVQEVLTWFKQLPEQQKEANEFMHNLNVIVKSDNVNPRNVGYAVALFPVYAKAMDQLYQQTREKKSNEWVGKPGEKLPPTKIKVVRTRTISGPFGSTQIVSMEDPQGNVLVWFNNSQRNMKEGEEDTITGTIKKHDVFNNRKQTHLTRVKTAKTA